MSAPEVTRELDRLAAEASDQLLAFRRRSAFERELRAALPAVVAVPAFYVALQWLRLATGGEPRLMPLALVAALALAAPFAWAWISARERGPRRVSRGRALLEVDERLGLEERLATADDLLARAKGRGAASAFEAAAIEDAAARARAAHDVELADAERAARWRERAAPFAAAAAALLCVAYFVGRLEPSPRAERAPDDVVVVAGGAPLDESPDEARPDDETARAAEEPPRAASDRAPSPRGAEPERAEAAPDVSDDVKEAAGKTGSGRSSGALSASAASESQSAPTSRGQRSDAAERSKQPKPKAASAKKPAEPKPEPRERPEDEESGATAGKGASRGSNKNPMASDWKSRDQVTETDEQETEEDEDTEDDEEEQESRGGVQPSLRDRRPPVSRDLQIGFGNRPNPDANGRGGPSEQKKSRGVASLVLGVPVPDRVKGRPGPGPTKVTQERIEPEAEAAAPIAAEARAPRAAPIGTLSALDLDPTFSELVRNYFLARRAAAAADRDGAGG